MLLNMRNIGKRKVQGNGDLYHRKILAITMTAIQIYLVGKKSTKRMTMNINQRNQVKSQKSNQGIHLVVKVTVTTIVTIRKEMKNKGAPVVAIGLKR